MMIQVNGMNIITINMPVFNQNSQMSAMTRLRKLSLRNYILPFLSSFSLSDPITMK